MKSSNLLEQKLTDVGNAMFIEISNWYTEQIDLVERKIKDYLFDVLSVVSRTDEKVDIVELKKELSFLRKKNKRRFVV